MMEIMAGLRRQSRDAKTKMERKFFEIVNWKKAQPRMKGGGQSWMKLYTSLLYHEGFSGLSSTDQMAIVALWLYAAVSGHHILPADPKWLMQRIPLLKGPPNLELLADVVDTFGNHNPFIKFCEPPKQKQTRKKDQREREREETNPSGSKDKKREKKRSGSVNKTKQQKKDKKEQKATEEPENPNKSDAGQVRDMHIVPMPRPARTVKAAYNQYQRLGDIIDGRFPAHWRDPDCESFGWEIVEALGMPRDPSDINIRSEWGAFSKWWSDVKSRASPLILAELRAAAISKARFINSPKARSARNKSAVWFTIMKGELNKYERTEKRAAKD